MAHVGAVERFDEVLQRSGTPNTVINLGTGSGVTVRELISTVEQVLGRRVPVWEATRRVGDAVGGFANVDKARASSSGPRNTVWRTAYGQPWSGQRGARTSLATSDLYT